MAQKFLNGIDVSSTTAVNGSNLDSGSTVLDVQGSQGQLFSVTNILTGDLFSVSDVSGSPILNVNSNGNIDIDGKLGINNNVPAYSLDLALDSVNDRINVTAGGAQKAIINGYGNIIAYGSLTSYNNTLGGGGGIFSYKGGTSTQTIGHRFQHVNSSFNAASGDQTMMQINPNINQSSTAGYTGIKLNVTETATGSGTKNLLDLQVGGTSKASISNAGAATFAGNVTAYTGASTGSISVGRNTNEKTVIHVGDQVNSITAYQDSDSNATHNFVLNRDFGGTGANNFIIQKGGTDQFTLDASANATFAGNIVMAANATVDGVDISALPTTFAPTNAEQNVQSDWNATSGDAQILNKLNRKFSNYWGDDRFVRTVGGSGADTGDKWVHLSTVAIDTAYEKVKIEFTIGSYDDNARGDERITVLYENHSSAQEGHILHWYKGDQIPTLFKAVKSIRSASSGLTNTYNLYVQIDGAWKDTFTVHAEWWQTHDAITYPTTAGGSEPTAGSDDKSLTSRQRWVDADMLDGYHLSTTRNSANTVPVRDGNGYLNLGWINTTSGLTASVINKIYVSDDNYIRYITPATFRANLITGHYLPLGGGILTGDLKLNSELKFQRDGTNYSNYIRSQQYASQGYDDDSTPANDRYWLEYGAKGGHHFVVNTDGGTGAVENAYDDFTIWQGEVDGDRLFEVTNVGNASLAGNLTVGGNLTVEGTVTTLNTATIEVEDNILQLNTTQASTDTATATTSGISVYRGVDSNNVAIAQASLIFDDGDDTWDLTNKLKVASNLNVGGNVFTIEANSPYIRGTGSGQMRIKHTSGETMYIRPDETGALSFFEGANSQSIYLMTQTPTVDDTTSESAKLLFHTRSKQSDGTAVSKYATIKHRTHSIGYNYTTLDFSGSDKSKFNMPIEAAGGLYYTGDAHMGFVPHPIGAQYRSDSSADTGYILIKLPTAVGATPDDMVSFHVDVYDYTTNEMISVFIGGYIYTSTATSSSYWYNCTAIINAKQTTKDFNVRFGYDGTNFYAAIGETNSVWSHPSIVLRDFQCSFRGNVEHYIDGWAISTETTALTGVDETQTGNFPQAKHAATATTATTATTASSVPYSGLTGTVPTWNQNTTGSAGSVAWGNITSKPYIETNGTTSATATTAIASVAHATYTAAFFDFVIKNGTNVRAGTVAACHDGTNVEFTETSTVDLGDTSDVTLNVVISTSYLQLQATTTSSTWTIKSLIRAI